MIKTVCGPQILEYLLSGFLQEKFAHPDLEIPSKFVLFMCFVYICKDVPHSILRMLIISY